MDWNGHAKFRLRFVEEPGMAAGLVVNVKPASQERTNHFLGFEDGEIIGHVANASFLSSPQYGSSTPYVSVSHFGIVAATGVAFH